MLAVFYAAVSALALANSVSAQGGFSQEELRALPRVCLAQKFINAGLRTPVVPEAERKKWAESLGPAYEAFHHYCWGLIDMRRASAAEPARARTHYLDAIQNFEYVKRNADASFPMLPEVLLRKGMALRLVGRDAAAATEFSEAITVKPDYTPAYAALVDVYVDLDDLEAAHNLLEHGLVEAPDSKILLNKKAELEKLTK